MIASATMIRTNGSVMSCQGRLDFVPTDQVDTLRPQSVRYEPDLLLATAAPRLTNVARALRATGARGEWAPRPAQSEKQRTFSWSVIISILGVNRSTAGCWEPGSRDPEHIAQ